MRFILILLCAAMLHSASLFAQQPTSVDIRMVPGAATGTLAVQVRANAVYSGVVSQLVFTIRWPATSAATVGPDDDLCLVDIAPSPQVTSGENHYRTYTHAGLGPLAPGCEWPANQWKTIINIQVAGAGECTVFSLLNDAWTLANNRNFYCALAGITRTGAIEANAVSNCAPDPISQPFELDTTWWMTDAVVHAIAEDTLHDRVVIGGEFTRLIPPYPTAYGGVVDITTGIMREGDVRPDDRVKCVVKDGSGGWYIGGDFLQVDGQFRQHLAHILTDGTLAPWNPVVNGAVNAMAIKGDTLYFGGNFTVVNGQSKSNLAAVRLSSGTNVVWGSAFADDVVRTMAINADDLFVGGDFTSVSGVTRNRIAVYNTSSHVLTGWSATVGGPVHTFGFETNVVMIGGDFTTVNGFARSRLARFSRSTAALDGWNPGPNGTVRCMQVDGANIYIGGDFTMINANFRGHLALVHSGGGTSTSWVNNTDGPVHSLYRIGVTRLLVGGEFDRVAGDVRHRAAELGIQGTSPPWLQPWAPAGDGTVRCIDVFGSNVYLGGGFNTLGLTRARVAMLDNTTGVPLPWSGNMNGPVYTIEVGLYRTYIGGDFDTVLTTGAIRSNLAAFEHSTDLLALWNPAPNGRVSDLAIYNTNLYACGSFTSAGGFSRNGLAQIDILSGGVGAMNVNATGAGVLCLSNDTLFMGGKFATIAGVSRARIAAIKVPSGALTSFDPMLTNGHPSFAVWNLLKKGSLLYFSGYFTGVNGQTVVDYARVRIADGIHLDWNPATTTPTAPLAHLAGMIYLAGSGDGGTTFGLRALDPVYGAETGPFLSTNGDNRTIGASADGHLFMGGYFTEVGGSLRTYFAKVRTTPTMHVRAYLEGPFNIATLMMDNNLSQLAAIPLVEPFTNLGYTHTGGGGGEVAPSSINNGTSSNAIVDWVLLELRDANDPSIIVASKSALVQRDGDIVGNDLLPILPFGPDPHGSYHIAVRSRNHLGAMTQVPMRIDENPFADFTEAGFDTYGTAAMKTSPFYNLLWMGDVNFDGTIKYTGDANDRDPILVRIGGTVPNNAVIGYFQEDATMNGVVKYIGNFNDRDPILVNIGGNVPTATKVQQIP